MSTTVTTTKRESRFVLNLRKYGLLYLMTLPGLAYLLINNYLPMAGLVIAFKDVDFRKGLFGSDWIGFKNFEYLFASSDALQITRNTLLYNAVFIIVNTVVAGHGGGAAGRTSAAARSGSSIKAPSSCPT